MWGKIKSKFEKQKKTKITILVILFAFMLYCAVYFLYTFPVKKYDTRKRDIGIIKQIIENNENIDVDIIFNNSEYIYKKDGTCALSKSCDAEGYCSTIWPEDYVFTDINHCDTYLYSYSYQEWLIEMNLEFSYRDTVFYMKYYYGQDALLFNAASGRYWSERTFSLFTDRERSLRYYRGSGFGCGYYPDNIFKTDCFLDDLTMASSILSAYSTLLEEMGVSELELIDYLRWYWAEFESEYVY